MILSIAMMVTVGRPNLRTLSSKPYITPNPNFRGSYTAGQKPRLYFSINRKEAASVRVALQGLDLMGFEVRSMLQLGKLLKQNT